ncbi:MAG: hypothetical protein V3T48_09190 [Vicinamibacterales bacterium]
MQLRTLAHTRCGDKGNTVNITVVANDLADYPRLVNQLTANRVRTHFGDLVEGEVERYLVPHLGVLNFVIRDVLAGGVTRSLALDAHGKALSSALLGLDVDD